MQGFEFLNKIPDWARWILFLPAAFVGSWLVSFVFALFASWRADAWMVGYAQSYLVGLSFVGLGAIMAPKKQFLIACILLTVVSMFAAVMFMLAFLVRHELEFMNILAICVHGVLLTVGGVTVTYALYDGEKRGEHVLLD